MYIKAIFVLALLAAVIYGYVVSVPLFSNTLEIRYLFFRAFFMGAFGGLALSLFLRKRTKDSLERVQITVALMVAGMLVAPLLAVLSNRQLASKEVRTQTAIFDKSVPILTSRFGVSKNNIPAPDGYYTYLILNQDPVRFRSKNALFKGIESGATVELPLKRGFWGFEFLPLEP